MLEKYDLFLIINNPSVCRYKKSRGNSNTINVNRNFILPKYSLEWDFRPYYHNKKVKSINKTSSEPQLRIFFRFLTQRWQYIEMHKMNPCNKCFWICSRKPQNLTPPGSSDGGSSGSGQSPTSTHPGSPPPITSTKRPGFQDGPDGFPYKRQRIAHGGVKPADVPAYRQPAENNSQRRPVTDSRDASNMNPRSRESPTSAYFGSMNGYANGTLNDKRNTSDDEDNATKKRSCDSHSLSFGVSREKTFLGNRSSSPAGKVAMEEPKKEVPVERQNGPPNGLPSWMKTEEREKEREKSSKYNKVSSSTQNRVSRVSPDSQTDSLPPADLEPPPVIKTEEKMEFPDYKQWVAPFLLPGIFLMFVSFQAIRYHTRPGAEEAVQDGLQCRLCRVQRLTWYRGKGVQAVRPVGGEAEAGEREQSQIQSKWQNYRYWIKYKKSTMYDPKLDERFKGSFAIIQFV